MEETYPGVQSRIVLRAERGSWHFPVTNEIFKLNTTRVPATINDNLQLMARLGTCFFHRYDVIVMLRLSIT